MLLNILTNNKINFGISSVVNEGIRAILNLFIFFFYKKIPHEQKAQNAYKQTKTKKAAFLCT